MGYRQDYVLLVRTTGNRFNNVSSNSALLYDCPLFYMIEADGECSTQKWLAIFSAGQVESSQLSPG